MSKRPTSGDNDGRGMPCLDPSLLLIFLSLVLWVMPQGVAEGRGVTTPDITIGIVGPMSGDMAELGRYVREAVELQTEEWNEKGGLLGRRIRLLIE
ncbi:MAG TPA: ABC transporter substrate-binding protein, partial [Candidatus Methylomirabilis sp.]|nr:ABC transporter substrate-binding protein [Candidatus Methylomirabilis sp.]